MKIIKKEQINKELYNFSKHSSFHAVPLGEIHQILKNHGYVVLDGNDKEWQGSLSGSNSDTFFSIADIDTKDLISDKYYMNLSTMLSLSWNKVENGKYEVIAYMT